MKKQVENENLRLIVLESAKELGNKIDEYLLDAYNLNKDEYTFIIPVREVTFDDGHGKVEIGDTVRGKDLFILTDIGNYSLTYEMHGFINHKSPNDLMMELKDVLSAANAQAGKMNLIMPLMFNARQHRKNTREPLSCGNALAELERNRKLEKLITFDIHDEGVEHALHNIEFDNFYATTSILENLITDLPVNELRNIVFVAPDNGATGRRNVYLNSFNSPYVNKEAGSFVKVRDYNKLVNGSYPVVSHDYIGSENLEGKTAIITDDMISSGGSMVDTIIELRKRGVKHVYVCVTYALFTKGIDKFKKLYDENLLDGIYTTNLSYIPDEYKKENWLHVCDTSLYLANIVYNLHNELSISNLLKDKSAPIKMLNEKFEKFISEELKEEKVKKIGVK